MDPLACAHARINVKRTVFASDMWSVGHRDYEVRHTVLGRRRDTPARDSVDGKSNVASTPERRLSQRQKQVTIGKNTAEYDTYVRCVPKDERDGNKEFIGSPRPHPRTPDPRRHMSKRAFDGRVRAWRRALHTWSDVPVTKKVPTVTASKWTLPPARMLRVSLFWDDE